MTSEDNIVASHFDPSKRAVVFRGGCLDFLNQCPDETFRLIVTSPPYNIGKEYEKRTSLDDYLSQQEKVIRECIRCLSPTGSICWQVGNHIDNGKVIPLDAILYPVFTRFGLHMRNRIIWTFGHGLHCSKRFSGRHETILWFTKSDNYIFNLDPVRIPQKYPNKKHFKGANTGQLSCNPLGKNPGDVWEIPNVKNNHVEKTEHPCQFPVGLVERLVLSMTIQDDWVFDPYLGSGTSVIAAVIHGRRGAGAETVQKYTNIAVPRIRDAMNGSLRIRPMNRPIHVPPQNTTSKQKSQETLWKDSSW